ncbi:hypothetical protein GCM10028796_10170 [Ramlibacter monticola]|uniref:Tandem-95 repeat protein n=1 Tax=Ramlibacter monticola TaxID=1926872 RepID=A0A936YXP9_9BURK|nr:Ig-like domain-containing protein [Ramlibacter monticola]MBL0389872.1 tandem-95 repeat protein [Ramlibacter monticola]
MLTHWLRRKKDKPPRPQRIAPHAEWLEPRLLYSADAGGLLGLDTAIAPAAEQRTLDAGFEYGGEASATTGALAADAVRAAYALTPLQFEADAGQLGEGVDFAASGLGYAVRLSGGSAELLLEGAAQPVRLELVGADPAAPEGQDLLATRSNYLVGADSSRWITDIVNYGSVLYRDVYEGIDVRYYGNQQQLEYDFVLDPGADATQLRLKFDGIESANVDANGDLVLKVAGTDRDLRFKAPVSYQEGAAGREAVESRYELQADGTVRIAVGAYDRSRALVVDPVLAHATYLGDVGSETAMAVAVGRDGSVYVTGHTNSNTGSFGAVVPGGADGNDSYVAKFSADLTRLLYVTRVGGSAGEAGQAIAVDADGNAVVAGWTKSGDFAVTAGADQATRTSGNPQEAFVYKLNSAGNALVFGTYFGAAGNTDMGSGVAIDQGGNIYVAGTVSGESDNAFLNKYTAGGTPVYKTQYGGIGGDDGATGIAVDAAGNAYIVGDTRSTGNVTLHGAQVTRPGSFDGFLAKFDGAGDLAYATYIGAGKADFTTGVAVDANGRAYVIGRTRDAVASGFVTTAGAFATTPHGHEAGFLRIYDTSLAGAASLVYSSFLGGSRDAAGGLSATLNDSPTGIAVADGLVVIVGHTDASDLPTTADAYSRINTSGDTGFALVLAPQRGGASDLVYGTYFGTGLVTGGVAWAGDQFYLVGSTTNSGIALATPDGYQPLYGGGGEAVVALFSGFNNVAPVLVGSNDLDGQLEDVPASGTLVGDLVAGHVSDADAGAFRGIAVTGVDTGNGSWEFTRDGGSTWATLAPPAAGSALLLNADALTRVRFVPAADYAGGSSITFRAWDRTSGTAGSVVVVPESGGRSAFSVREATAAVAVAPVNDAPRLGPDHLGATEDQALTIAPATLLGNDLDVEGDGFTVTGVGAATGGSVALSDGEIVFTPAPDFNGTASFEYTVTDANGASATGLVTVTVAAVNDAPTGVAAPLDTDEDTPLTITPATLLAQFSDVDGDTLTVIGVANGTGGTVALSGGNLVFTPRADFSGAGSFSYTVSDGHGGAVSVTVAVNVAPVNDPPVVANDTATASLNLAIDIPASTLLANDTDADGDTLTIVSVGGAAHGSVTLSGSTIRFVPDLLYLGNQAEFTYTVSDGHGATATGTVHVSVLLSNNLPEAVNDSVSATEDVPLAIAAGDLLANDTDPDLFDVLAITSVDSGTGGTVTLSGETITFTPDADFNGTARFTYTVADKDGATATGVVTVDVAPANDAPRLADDTVSGVEDQRVVIEQAALLGNDTDVDDGVLAIVSVQSATGGSVDFSGGDIVFTPDLDFNGRASFTYTVRDPAGLESTATVWVDLAAVNDAPVLGSVVLGTDEDTALPIDIGDLLGRAADAEGDALTIVGVANGTGGTVTLSGASIVFTPAADFNGNAQFSYTVSDGQGGTTTGALTVVVGAVNDAPEAGGDALAGTEDEALTIASESLLGNDSDQDGDVLAITDVESISGGAVVLAGGRIVFTPTPDFDGAASFRYAVSDGHGGTATAVVTVDLAAVNDPPQAADDTVSGGVEDQPLTIDAAALLANDTDVEGRALAIIGVADVVGGTVSLLPSGDVLFTPAPDFAGAAGFTYLVSDGNGGTATGFVTVNVAGVNDGPLAGDDSVTATEDQPLTILPGTLLGNDSDVDADALTIMGVTSGTGGTVTLVGGNIVFTPTANFNGAGTFTYTVSDGNGGTATATVTVTVASVNDQPQAGNDSVTATEDQPLTILPGMLLGNDSDVDADTLTITGVTSGTGGTVALVGGSIVFTPTANFNGAGSFTYTVSDSNGGTATGLVTVNVVGVNDGPVAGDDSVTATEDQPLTILPGTLLGNDSDVDADTLTITDVTSGTGGTVTLVGGNIVFTPIANFNGAGSFTYTVSDGNGGTATATVTVVVTPVNDQPQAGNDSVTATEDQPLTILPGTLLGNDSDVDPDTLTITGVTGGSGGTVALVGGNIVFTPTANFNGAGSFTYTVSDGNGGTATATVTVTVASVNDQPQAGNDSVTATEDQPLTILPGTLLGNDSDVDADTLTITGVTSGTGGTVTLVGGNIVFTPIANFNGAGSFTYTVSDGNGGTATATVTVTVASVNDQPQAGNDSVTATEDQPLTILPGMLLGNDSDVDADTLTITGVTSGTGGTVTLVGGNIVFTPTANFNGAGSFTYTVSDGNGGIATATVTVNVAAVNDGPVTADDTVTGSEDQPLTILPGSLLANDTDVDADTLTITGVTGGTGGTVALVGGNIVFTPTGNFNGTGSFTYTVSDGNGGTTTATVTVTVASVNDQPQVGDDSVAATEDQPLTILPGTLLGNDDDVDPDTLTITGVTSGTGGIVALVGGNIVFTPTANFNGAGNFTYTVSDGNGGTATATVTVNVAGVNDGPVAGDDSVTVTEDQPLTILPGMLLGNDSDVDADALTITGVTSGAGGTVALVGSSIVFTPIANFNGAGSFTYTVSDGNGGTATATVTVNVAAVNDGPVTGDDTVTGSEDQPLTILPGTLFANDSDVDADTLTITDVTSGTGGTVALVGGNIVFTPTVNFNGAANFTYTVSDGNGGTTTATVTVTVTPINDQPQAGNDSVTATEDQPLSILPGTLLANDSDVDADTLTITGVTSGTGGTVTLVGGNIVFTPTGNFNGTGSFTYTVSDGNGDTTTATVTVTVASVNDQPQAGNDSVAATEDQPLTILPATLLANDTDVDADTLTITGVTSGTGGTVALVGSNIVFTPAANFNGAGSFTYTVSDGKGGTATATVTVIVADVNDGPVAGDDSVTAIEDQPLTILPGTLLGNDSDVDADTLTITGVTSGTGGTVALVGGNIVFTPSANFNGAGSFTYTVSDGHGGITTAAVTVTVASVNDQPQAGNDSVTATEDQPLTILPGTLLANDTDVDADTLTITGVTGGTGGTVTLVGGNIVFTPIANFNGAVSFSYTVTDGNGGTATGTVTVNVAAVNDGPVAGDDSVTAIEDQPLTILPGTLVGNDSDVDADALTITGVSGGTGGTVALVGGSIVFTPTANFNGAGSFTYTVSDSNGGTATGLVTVNVAGVNDGPVAGDDSVTATEDQPLTILPGMLLGNDSDVDADALTITGVTSGSGGTVALVGSSIVFTPIANFNGAGNFTYTVSDGNGGTTTATVTVTVASVNDQPQAGDDSVTATEDQPLTILPGTLLGNDSDSDGDTLTITGVTGGTGGTVALVGGNIVFTPTANFNGAGSFTYTVSDGKGGTATSTVTVNVAGVNDGPVGGDDSVTGTEDQPLTILPGALIGNDSDVDTDALTIIGVTGGTGGTVTLVGGNIVFTPTGNFNGAGSFIYTVSDGKGGIATARVNVTVDPVNDQPEAGNDSVTAAEDQPLTILPGTLLGNDSDVDADTLTITGVTSGTGGTVALVGGNVLFTPTANFNGAGSFTYTVGDGNGGTATATVTVNVASVNDAPAAGNDAFVATEDQPLTIAPPTLLANDSDVDADSLTITGGTGGTGGTVALVGGNIVFTPTANFNGAGSFTYTVSDGNGGTTTATVTVTVASVNDQPQAGDDSVTATEDQPLTILPGSLLANDSDVDADTLTITGVTSGTGGTVALVGGKIVFTPTANFNGGGSFTYTVSDGNGGTTTATVTVTVASVNDQPQAGNDSVTATEDQPLTILPTTLLANDTDVDADTLTITGVTGGTGGTVSLVGGNIVFTPTSNFNGAGSFTYTVSDGNGGTATATVTVNVAAMNDGPVAGDDSVTAIEDQPLTILPATLLSNDSDVDADALTITGVTSGAGGAVALVGGNIVFAPTANFNGAGNFTYTVSDGKGGITTATVNVTVDPINDQPQAGDDSVTATEDQPLTILPGMLLGNDSDVDADALTITGVTGGTGGTVSLVGGNIVFTPTSNFNGAGSFTYTVSDGNGGTATATVTINVAAVNDGPLAGDDSVTATEDQPLTILPGTLLGNDTDADADSLTITGVTSSTGGAVALVGGNIVFTPTANFNGTGSFTYTVSDGNGGTATATVTVNVASVNDAPAAVNDALAATEDQPLTIAPPTLLANDSDAEGDALSITSVTSGTGGTVRLVNGAIVFTPAADFNGPATFTYTVSDGNGGTATAKVTLDVAAVDDPTVITDDAATGTEDGLVAGNVLANDVDPDSALAIASFRIAGNDYAAGSSVALRGVGTLTLAAGGNWSFRPEADWNGEVLQVAYTTSTGATGVLAIRVSPVNDAPVRSGTPQEVAVSEGATASLGFAGISYGVGGGSDEAASQVLTVRVTGLPSALGTITLADGTVVASGSRYTVAQLQGMVFHAAVGTSGSATFSFNVSDDAGGTDTLSEQLTIRVANQAPVLDGANVLPSVREDASDNAGIRVEDLLAGHASDPGGRVGVAVVSASSSAGQWQFSRDGGAHWSNFEGVSAASAELLWGDGQTRIRFVADADWNGTATGLAFCAWDGSGGTAGAARADTTVNGGSSAFSAATATASITVDAVNDAPTPIGVQAGTIGIDSAAAARSLAELAWSYATGGGGDEAGQALTVTFTALPPDHLGTLVLADGTTPVVAGRSYTPEQLRGLRFVATSASADGTAEVQWMVRDDGGTARGGVDQAAGGVRITVVGQVPPPPPSQPLTPPAPAVPPLSPTQPATSAPPAPSPATPPATARPAGAVAEDPLVAPAAPVATLPVVNEVARLRVAEPPDTARVMGLGSLASTDLKFAGLLGQGDFSFELTGLNFELSSARMGAEQFQQSLRSGVFVEELNRLREQLHEEFDLDRSLSVSVAGLSLGVSVAYVLWLVRGGVLVGSYLSALPAWRLLDPLPVLARAGEEEEDEDEDETFDSQPGEGADPLRGFS